MSAVLDLPSLTTVPELRDIAVQDLRGEIARSSYKTKIRENARLDVLLEYICTLYTLLYCDRFHVYQDTLDFFFRCHRIENNGHIVAIYYF